MSGPKTVDETRTMESKLSRFRILGTVAILLAEAGHLAWEYFHGGVHAHHIMQNADLPAISNWWGLLLLPVLAWFLIGRVLKRSVSSDGVRGRIGAGVWLGFVLSVVFGAALAFTTVQGYETVSSYMFYALFPLALVFPLHRSQYILGFILGMTFTVGAVLPTVFAFIFAGLAALLQLGVRFVRRLFRK